MWLKVFHSVAQWKSAWKTDRPHMISALDGRNVVLIRGGKDLLKEDWSWDKLSFERVLPGAQRIDVQGVYTSFLKWPVP